MDSVCYRPRHASELIGSFDIIIQFEMAAVNLAEYGVGFVVPNNLNRHACFLCRSNLPIHHTSEPGSASLIFPSEVDGQK
jgi:hypothetical protein